MRLTLPSSVIVAAILEDPPSGYGIPYPALSIAERRIDADKRPCFSVKHLDV